MKDTSPQTARPILVPVIVGCALFMQMLDSTVIATALPVMARSLGESPVRLNLAITAYMLSAAIFIPVSGWVADRFGARSVFRIAIALFAASSVLCAVAQNLPELVAARALQGAAGAMMVPVGRIVLLRSVAKADLVKALSYLTIPALLGPVLGPPVGGFIVTYGSWQWIFLINVPIAVLGIVLVTIFIPDTVPVGRRPFDLRGFALAGAGLAILMFGFESLGRSSLPAALLVAAIAAGLACCLLYVRHAVRSAAPLIDVRLFRLPSFSASILGGSLVRLGLGATPFLLTMLLQVAFGLSALAAGLLTFASAAGALLMKFTAPPIIARFGMRRVLVATGAVAALSSMAYALFTAATPHAVIIAVLLVTGFFRSLLMTSLNALAFAEVREAEMSHASTLSSMMVQLSFSVGVGLAAVLIHVSQALAGRTAVVAADVSPAFIVFGVLGLLAVVLFLRLPPEIGSSLGGARSVPAVREAANPRGAE